MSRREAAIPSYLVLSMLLLLLLCVNDAISRSSPPPKPQSIDQSKNATASANCEIVKPFFESKNISVDFLKDPPEDVKTTCNGQCCSRDVEDLLRHQVRTDFQNLIHHNSRTLQGLLATTADALRETVTILARQSENKTLNLFNQVYRSMALQSRPSIRSLYQAMVDYVSPKNTPDNLQQPLTREALQERFINFFTKLFPIAYHRTVNPHQQDFTEKFKSCLYETMDEIQPFGEIPKQVSQSVSKSLEATRVLVQALTLGKTVLHKTDSVLFSGSSSQQEACYAAILRMTYCPRCKGFGTSVKPCRGFCTNVMRGCLTKPASEFDLAWTGYVETVERLVVAVDGRNDPLGLNAERAVRQLDTRISDAIMHAMENGPALEEKVRKVCGRSELQSSSEMPNFEETSTTITRTNGESLERYGFVSSASSQSSASHRSLPTQLHQQLGNFLASVVRSRTFYGTLADTICEVYPDRGCWNGVRVGEYTHTVVDSSLNAQKYNPEFTSLTASTASTYGNSNTSALIDQLRHINQMVQTQLASAPDTSALLADEVLDGSGSGARPDWRKPQHGGAGGHRSYADVVGDDEDGIGDDSDGEEGSGSGEGPGVPDHGDLNPNPPTTVGSATQSLICPLALGLVCITLLV